MSAADAKRDRRRHDLGATTRRRFGVAAGAVCAVIAVAVMFNRPRGGIRMIDAGLFTLTRDNFSLAALLHATVVFGLSYGVFRIVASRFGIASGCVSTALLLVVYVYFYFTWGIPMVG